MEPKAPQHSLQGMEIPVGVLAQAEAVASNNSGHSTTHRTQQPASGNSRSSTYHGDSGHEPSDSAIEHAPPPPYSETYGTVDMSQDGLDTRASVANDGRVNINIDQKSRKLSNLLVPALRSQLNIQQAEEPSTLLPGYIPPALGATLGKLPPPRMNVVIHVVGSRGDVQPFVALGKVLRETHGHRVRLATHPVFKDFVEENGLEFFSIGGDPAELMAFMVKNPGLMPGKDALRKGDIGRRRKGMYEIIRGCWRSCYEAGDGQGTAVSDDMAQDPLDPSTKPFVADAIIANPPSFAHIHCAEKLGIHLHLMFTMPWSPTQSFPHPLANIQSSNADTNMTNFISYALVEMMTWQGLGDIINRFREKSLGLEPISLMAAPGIATRLRIPYTYCWSPALIPKPMDWGTHISISGFYFLSLAADYQPEHELLEFLEAGSPPVYIGFGSIVVDEPNSMTDLIFEAVKSSGQRALVSKGWGGLGADVLRKPDDVFMLGNVPHDWLFKHVSCVVHHGGAGTTAAGIALGKPTVIVPFFGDQPFWGAMVAKAGAGPPPIPNETLTSENLSTAIRMALQPSTQERAKELGARIAAEKGSDVGAKAFHDRLNVGAMRCFLSPNRVAVWQVKKSSIVLSGFAATTLANEGLLDFGQLELYRAKEYDTDEGPWEPITGAASALVGTIGSLMMGVADVPIDIFKTKSSKIPKASPKVDANKPASTVSQPEPDKAVDGLERGQPHGEDHGKEASSNQLSSEGTIKLPSERNDENRQDTSQSTNRALAQDNSQSGLNLESAIGAGKGIGRIVDAGLKSPMDFTLSLAKGFHNAPKLYGDSSVRPHDRITGFQSGLRAAGKEFGYGFYDGISGLVTQPLEGAKKEGFAGFLKGFGKGIGGVVLKPGAGIWGLPGYTFKGIYKELQKRLGSSVQNYIVAARTAQGYEEWNASSEPERLDIVSRWHAAQVELLKQQKQRKLSRSDSTRKYDQTKHVKHNKQNETTKQEDIEQPHGYKLNIPVPKSEAHAISPYIALDSNEEDMAFENAIKESVLATSTGNPEEDHMIEQAIRASIAELRQASGKGNDNILHEAIRASTSEADRARAGVDKTDDGSMPESTADKEQIKAAIQLSLKNHENYPSLQHAADNSDIGSEEYENVKAALQESRTASHITSEDTDLAKALAESLKYQ